ATRWCVSTSARADWWRARGWRRSTSSWARRRGSRPRWRRCVQASCRRTPSTRSTPFATCATTKNIGRSKAMNGWMKWWASRSASDDATQSVSYPSGMTEAGGKKGELADRAEPQNEPVDLDQLAPAGHDATHGASEAEVHETAAQPS